MRGWRDRGRFRPHAALTPLPSPGKAVYLLRFLSAFGVAEVKILPDLFRRGGATETAQPSRAKPNLER